MNGDISVCDDLDLDHMISALFPEYSIIISCQIFSVKNGDISVCDDLDLHQIMFASFPEYSIIMSCQIFSVVNRDTTLMMTLTVMTLTLIR